MMAYGAIKREVQFIGLVHAIRPMASERVAFANTSATPQVRGIKAFMCYVHTVRSRCWS